MATYFGHLLPEVKNRAKQIAAGSNHNVLLTQEGKIYNWGDNSKGQLGNGTTANSSTATIVNPAYLENPNAYSVYFNSSNDMLTVSSLPGPSTNDFTYEAWVYPTSSSVSYRVIFGIDNYSGTTPFRLYQYGTNFQFWYIGTAGNFYNSNTISINQWYHLTITRQNLQLRFFVNGILVGGPGQQSASYPTSNFRIGRDSAGSYPFLGFISNVRVINGTALYTENFTPPTEPLTAITGTSLLTCQNATFKDNSENNFTITVAGNSSPSTVSPFNYSLKTSTYGYISAASSTTAAISIDGELLMWGDNSSNQIGITSSTSVTLPVNVSTMKLIDPNAYSVYFDGNGDYLISGNAVVPATSDFTLEFWIYPTSTASRQMIFSQEVTHVISGRILISYNWNAAQKINIFVGGATNMDISSTTLVQPFVWTHLAIAKIGSTYKIYINGIEDQTTGTSLTSIVQEGWGIGARRANISVEPFYFQGYISNLRVVKGIAIYTSNFTPSTSPLTAIQGTVLLTCQNATFKDNSANNFTITAAGNSSPNITSPFNVSYENVKFQSISLGSNHALALTDDNILYAWGNNASGQLGNGTTVTSLYPREITITSTSSYSVFFDGSGDYLTLSGIPLTSAVTEFTIEAWIYPTSNANQSYIYAQYSGSDARRTTFYRETNTTINFFHPDIGTNIVKSSATANNVWLHVAVTRDTSNTLRLFVNGKLEYTYNNFTNYLQQINGQIGGVGASYFVGYISNLRVVNKALYISDFIPSSTPLTATDETVLLICQDSNINNLASNSIRVSETFGDLRVARFSPFTVINKFKSISAGNGYSLALTENNELYAWGENSSGQLGIGNTTDQTLPVKVYNPVYDYSVYFDGSGDWLSVVDTGGLLAHGPNNFTYEFWIKPSGSFSTGYILHQYGKVIDSMNIIINSTTGVVTANIRATNQASLDLLSPADSIVIGRWSHVAIMRNGATLVLAVNGNVYSAAISANTQLNENQNSLFTPLRFGSKSNLDANYFKGYISNVRIIRGRALYTTSYNVPTEPFTLTDDTVFLGLQSPTLVDKGPFNFKLTATGNTVVAADESPFLDNANKWNNLASGNSHTFAITKNQELYATGDGTSRKLGNEFVTVSSSLIESTEYLGSSVYFDGTGVLRSTAVAAAVGSGDFTVECWFFATDIASTKCIFSTRSGNTNDGIDVCLSSGVISINHTGAIFNSGISVSTNKWYHLTITKIGSTTSKIFLNYGLIGSYTPIFQSSQTITVGGRGNNSDRFIGYISNFRFSNEVLYNDDGVGIPKSYSVYFDGSGDYLSLPSNSLNYMHQGSVDWTFETWFYTNSTSIQTLLSTTGSTAQVGFQITINNPSGTILLQINRGSSGNDYFIRTAVTTILTNTWYHIAVTFNSVSKLVKIFLNGIEQSVTITGTATFSTANATYAPSIGRFLTATVGAGGYMLGYISNLRVVSGEIIYTSNFTPSNSPLFNITNTNVLTCQDAIFKDNSTNNFTITVVGNSIVRHFNPFGFNKIAPLTVTSSTVFLTCNSNARIDTSINEYAITIPLSGTPSVSDLGPFKNKIFAKQAAVGGGHSLIIDSNNKLRSFGLNSSGQLGSTRNYEIVKLYKTDYYSNYFVGTNYLSVNGGETFNIGQGNFTVESWIYPTNVTENRGIWQLGNNSSGLMGATTGLMLQIYNNSFYMHAAGISFVIPNFTTIANTWYHTAVVRNSGVTKLYVNGIEIYSFNDVYSYPNYGYFGIGGGYGTLYLYKGYISNFRVVKGTALYTSNFNPPTELLTAIENTSLLTCQDATFKDNSTNNFTITVNGNTAISKFAPSFNSQNERIQDTRLIAAGAEHSFIYTQNRINNFYRTAGKNTSYQLGDNTTINKSSFITANINQSYSVFYDGASDYLIYPNSTQFGLGTGDFTIEMWVYVYAVNDINWLIDFRTSGGGAAQVKPELTINNSGGIDYVYGSGNIIAQTVTGLVTANAWHHIALVRNSGTSKIFYDGIEKDSKPDTVNFGTSATVTLGTVGDSPGYTTTEFNGFMSNVRVVKGVALYTGNFTPPTRPLTAISGTSLLVCQDNVFRDNSVNNFSVAITGETKTSSFNPFVILD